MSLLGEIRTKEGGNVLWDKRAKDKGKLNVMKRKQNSKSINELGTAQVMVHWSEELVEKNMGLAHRREAVV